MTQIEPTLFDVCEQWSSNLLKRLLDRSGLDAFLDWLNQLNLLARLILEVDTLLKVHNMPEVDIAALFGVSQLRVSNLLQSRINLVTAYTLIN